MRQILWGLFCKLVVADNCALHVDKIFAEPAAYPGSALIAGAMLFAVQVYGDFAGYSHIAIGTAALFGFKLMRNFAYPFFSCNMAELWRKWHISLTTWIGDYIYMPLAKRNKSKSTIVSVRNIFIIFLITGFWHGANWTFIIWGAINAVYVAPYMLQGKRRNRGGLTTEKGLPALSELVAMLFTFGLFSLAAIFFRANDVVHALTYLRGICSFSLLSIPTLFPVSLIALLVGFMLFEWIGRNRFYAFACVDRFQNMGLRWSAYLFMIGMIVYFMVDQQRFIYFQF